MPASIPTPMASLTRRDGLRRLAGGAAALSLALAGRPARADALQLVVGGLDKLIYLPVVLAQQLGCFAAQGLEVSLRDDSSGARAEDKLLAGAVQGVVGFYDHTVALQAQGKFVQAVLQIGQAPGEVLLARPGIARIAELAGQSLGVAGLGSSTHRLSQYLALTSGLKPGALNFVSAEAGPAFVAAWREGRIAAGMTTEPTASRLLRSGEATLLVDLRTPAATAVALGGPYPGACLYLASRWIESHRDEVQRLVKALRQALQHLATHEAEAIADAVPPALWGGDRALYVQALQAARRTLYTADGRMPAGGPETVLKVIAQVSRAVQGRTIDLGRTTTDAYVDAAGG